MSPSLKMLIGLAVTVGSAWVFHGPTGGGERVLRGLEAQVQPLVRKQELTTVNAAFARDPLSRDLRFSGAANDFQRSRYVEIVQDARIEGLRSIAWEAPAAPTGAAR